MWFNSSKQISQEPVTLPQKKLQEHLPPGVKVYTKQYQPLTNVKYNIIDNTDTNDIHKIKQMIHEFHHMPTEHANSNNDIPTGVNSNSKENHNQINLSKIPSQNFTQKDLPSQQLTLKQLTLTQMEKIDINIGNGHLINGITYDDQLCQLQISKQFLEIIAPFQKINFICAIGSAKSTFLNSLLGFPSGQAVRAWIGISFKFYLAKGQGFHIWTTPLYCPVTNSYTYFAEVILSKNNSHFNAQILILSHLLCSTMLLTSRHHLTNETFEELSYLKKFRNYVDLKNAWTKQHFTQQQLIIVTRKMKFNMSHQEFLWNFLSSIDNELSHKIMKHFAQIFYYSLDIEQLASIWDATHCNYNNINKVRYQCIQSHYSGINPSMLLLVVKQLNQGGQLYHQQAYLGLCNLEKLELLLQEQLYINLHNKAFHLFKELKQQIVTNYDSQESLPTFHHLHSQLDAIKQAITDQLNSLKQNQAYHDLIYRLIDDETHNANAVFRQIVTKHLQAQKQGNPSIYLLYYNHMLALPQFKYIPRLISKLIDAQVAHLSWLQKDQKKKHETRLHLKVKQQMNTENDVESMKLFYLEQIKKENVKKNVLLQEIEGLEEIKNKTLKQQDILFSLVKESNNYREKLEKRKQKIGLVILK